MRRVVVALLFVVALIGLYFTDRELRRMEKADEVVLKGGTGLPWIDDYLARRSAAKEKQARYETEVSRLLAIPAAASTPEKRIDAHYAVARYVSAQGHGDSKLVTESWLAIVREGKSMPQTREAWRGLIEQATKSNDREAMRPLIEGYYGAVRNSPNDSGKLFALIDAWRLSARHGVIEIEIASLETIHAEFPGDPDALEAYEALAQKYRRAQQPEKLQAVEESAREARVLLIQRSSDAQSKRRSTK